MSELLARLNAKTVQFNVGSGGIPELENSDIAAALGMVRNKLGVDVLEYMHCSDERRKFLIEVRCFEHMRNAYNDSMNDEIAYHIHALARPTFIRRAVRFVAQPFRAKDAARPSVAWPPFESRNIGMYVRVVLAVLAEIVSGADCKSCNGGLAPAPAGMGACPECGGAGVHHNPQRLRAAAMRIPLSQFQRKWEAPYRWLLTELVNAMAEANREFRAALGRKSA